MADRNFNHASDRFIRAKKIFKNHGGLLKTSQAIRAGIHPATLYSMRDSGMVERISRGVYRLSDVEPLSNPDLVTVAARIPGGVICLISALSFYDLTTQIPHEIHVALKKGAEEPRITYPPVKTYRFSLQSFSKGRSTHKIDNLDVTIYSPEKTIADCFKFRNRIGLETAVEAVRLYRERREIDIDSLMYYSGICRVRKIIRPYLEALL